MNDESLRAAYSATFKSDLGTTVLDDLRMQAHLLPASGADSPTEMAFLAGQRFLLMRIYDMMLPAPNRGIQQERQTHYSSSSSAKSP